MANKRDREVPIEVIARHHHVSDKTRTMAVEKAERLIKYNDRISRIQVLLDEEHERFVSEVIVHVEAGGTFVAKEAAPGYRAAVDLVVEKMERQLKKDKEKRVNHKHEPLGGPHDAGDSPDDTEQSFDDAVREDLSK